MSAIQLFDGSFFDFHAPENCDFGIENIARSLSHICRFNGHCERFYSIAQHCVMVAELCTEENQLAGLLHDATEAFLCDLPSPIKRMIPTYREYEGQVMALILERYELASVLPREVKHNDLVALATEVRDLLPNKTDWNFPKEIKPVTSVITPWTSDFARKMFLDKFHVLNNARS